MRFQAHLVQVDRLDVLLHKSTLFRNLLRLSDHSQGLAHLGCPYKDSRRRVLFDDFHWCLFTQYLCGPPSVLDV